MGECWKRFPAVVWNHPPLHPPRTPFWPWAVQHTTTAVRRPLRTSHRPCRPLLVVSRGAWKAEGACELRRRFPGKTGTMASLRSLFGWCFFFFFLCSRHLIAHHGTRLLSSLPPRNLPGNAIPHWENKPPRAGRGVTAPNGLHFIHTCHPRALPYPRKRLHDVCPGRHEVTSIRISVVSWPALCPLCNNSKFSRWYFMTSPAWGGGTTRYVMMASRG